MENVHKGHRQRVKQEFRKMGLEHFPEHKIMEILLFYSISRSDTNVIGHNLIKKFGSLSSVFDAPYELLCETDGIGEESATLIKLVAAVAKAYMNDHASPRGTISNLTQAEDFMKYKFLNEQRECIYAACLGNNGRVLLCDRVSEGAPEAVGIVPSDIAKMALRANAVHVVIAHNHPHGICNPSSSDLRTTNILYDELQRVGIELVDHIIVAADGVYSMKRNNLFPDFWK